MALQIMMDDKTRDFLTTKEALTISRLQLNGCCVPTIEVETTFSTPNLEQEYYHIIDQVIPIYIEKSLEFKENQVKLRLMKFRPFTSIQVDGLKRF